MTFFYFSATQTTPRGLGGCPPSPSGGIAPGRLEKLRRRWAVLKWQQKKTPAIIAGATYNMKSSDSNTYEIVRQ